MTFSPGVVEVSEYAVVVVVRHESIDSARPAAGAPRYELCAFHEGARVGKIGRRPHYDFASNTGRDKYVISTS